MKKIVTILNYCHPSLLKLSEFISHPLDQIRWHVGSAELHPKSSFVLHSWSERCSTMLLHLRPDSGWQTVLSRWLPLLPLLGCYPWFVANHRHLGALQT